MDYSKFFNENYWQICDMVFIKGFQIAVIIKLRLVNIKKYV